MKQRNELDEAVALVRADEAPATVAAAAAARVWSRVAAAAGVPAAEIDAIRGCADVQALLPAHRESRLAPARALLVEDHLAECATCRAALRQPGVSRLALLPWRAAGPSVAARRTGRIFRPALAAAALASVGIAGVIVQRAFVSVPPGSRASVQSMSGVLQRVAEQARALQPGQELGEKERVRTARGARAHLKLHDGSVVEMGERAELYVTARGKDTTIHLERGSIIVQAAKRRAGHLRVATKDCVVSVTGTVFSVNDGLVGSRVSVIEGQVEVKGGGEEKLLQPGDQWATSASMGGVPVRDEIGWSRDLDQHLALLGELRTLRQKWVEVETPGVRRESRVLAMLPQGTVVFASLPNYGQALAEAYRLFEERLQESPVLRDWWGKADPARSGGPNLPTIVEKLRSFSDFLGDEIAFVALLDAGNRRGPEPLLLAEVRRPGLREFIEAQSQGPRLQILDDVSELSGAGALYVLLRDDRVAVSTDAGALRRLEQAPQDGGLAGTPFGERITEAYRDGVGLLFAADLERVAAATGGAHGHERDALRVAGLDGVRHFIMERKQILGQAQTEASLTFTGPRRGVLSWLGAPGAMGSLDFVSRNALAAAAFLSKSPSLVLDDILNVAATKDEKAALGLHELESKLDLRIREDLAETLGSEFAFALDGPILPTPAWKLVVEVSDPSRLQASLQTIVGKANDEAVRASRTGLELVAEQAAGQTYYSIRGGALPFEVHYTFSDGYLVACPTRAMVMQALRTHEGESLGRSDNLRALFPPGRRDHVSALLYQNLGGVFAALPGLGGAARVSPEQQRVLDSLSRDAKPTLICVYGEPEGIQVAGNGGFLDFDPANLALPFLLGRGVPGTIRPLGP